MRPFHLLPVLAACAAMGLRAADLVVGEGQSQVLSGTASYDKILVNGDLTIDSDANITTEYLCVASNNTGTARLTLNENANLKVNAASAMSRIQTRTLRIFRSVGLSFRIARP